MNTLVPTAARFSARARSARRPCRASAMPRLAKTRAAASGMAASSAAMTGRWRVASTIRYWAVKLTAAAAAARTPSPAAALRSHRPEWSADRLSGAGWLPLPAGLTSARTAGRDRASRRPGCLAAAGDVRAGSGVGEGDERDREGHGRSLSGKAGHEAGAGVRRCGRRRRAGGG